METSTSITSTASHIPTATSNLATSPTATLPASVCRGTVCRRMLTAIEWSSEKAIILGVGVNNGLFYKNGDGINWDSNWTPLGGNFTYPPVAIS